MPKHTETPEEYARDQKDFIVEDSKGKKVQLKGANTVPEDRVFNVTRGTFLPDVELVRIIVGPATLTVPEANLKGHAPESHVGFKYDIVTSFETYLQFPERHRRISQLLLKMEVFVRDLSSKFQSFSLSSGTVVRELVHIFAQKQAIPATDFYIKCNGSLASDDDVIRPGVVYSLEPRLCGGKGGFGSMLRALGAQIEKTTNREACRDLSGRRLRDVNHEKEMADWIKKQAEREAEKEQRRIERLQRKLAEPKHYFTDPNYEQQCHELSERLEDSVLKGMQASSSAVVEAEEGPSRKRPIPSKEPKSGKRKRFWTGVYGLEDSGSSDEDSLESDREESPSTSGVSSGETKSPKGKGKASAGSCSNAEETRASSSSSGSNSPQKSPAELVKEEAMVATMQAQPDAELPGKSGNVLDEKKETQEERETEEETQETSLEKPGEPQPGCSSTHSADNGPLDLMTFSSASELEVLGLERMKTELMALGLKCGGTLQERAARLFSVRGKSKDQIEPALFAKPAKGKKK
ncbi:UNVERIFIED_CONTAM: hypothetical protein FKN15_008956 [Acipenser sinensis]